MKIGEQSSWSFGSPGVSGPLVVTMTPRPVLKVSINQRARDRRLFLNLLFSCRQFCVLFHLSAFCVSIFLRLWRNWFINILCKSAPSISIKISSEHLRHKPRRADSRAKTSVSLSGINWCEFDFHCIELLIGNAKIPFRQNRH